MSHDLPPNIQIAIQQIVSQLQKVGPDTGVDSAELFAQRDEMAREVARTILRLAEVYDAHGCPLCLS